MIRPHDAVLAEPLAWLGDPVALGLLGLAGFIYWRGWWRSPRSRHLTRGRAAWFGAGLIAAGVAIASPLDHLAGELFLAHMVQHLLLANIAAPLILLGAPLLGLGRGLPAAVRRRLGRVLGRGRPAHRVVAWLFHPVTAWLFYVGALSVWQVPRLYELALRVDPIHLAEHATLFGTGILFWSRVIDPFPLRAALPLPARIPYVFAASMHGIVVGALLTFARAPVYPYYADLWPRPWGWSALIDQQVSALTLWILGGLIYLTAILVLFGAWLLADEAADGGHRRHGTISANPGSE